MAKEVCSLCGFEIASNESAYVLNDDVVCGSCYRINAGARSATAEPRVAPTMAEASRAHEGEHRANMPSTQLQDPTRDTKILNTYCGILRAFGYLFLGIAAIGAVVSTIVGVVGGVKSHAFLSGIAGGIGIAIIVLAAGGLLMFLCFLNAAVISAFSSIAQNIYHGAVARDRQ